MDGSGYYEPFVYLNDGMQVRPFVGPPTPEPFDIEPPPDNAGSEFPKQVAAPPNKRDVAMKKLLEVLNSYTAPEVKLEQPGFQKRDLLTGALPTLLLSLMNKDAGAAYASGFVGGRHEAAARKTQQNQLDAQRYNQQYQQRLRAAQFALESMTEEAPEPKRLSPQLQAAINQARSLGLSYAATGDRDLEIDDPDLRAAIRTARASGGIADAYDKANGFFEKETPYLANDANAVMHQARDTLIRKIDEKSKYLSELRSSAENAPPEELEQWLSLLSEVSAEIAQMRQALNYVTTKVYDWREGHGFTESGDYQPWIKSLIRSLKLYR